MESEHAGSSVRLSELWQLLNFSVNLQINNTVLVVYGDCVNNAISAQYFIVKNNHG